MKIGLLTISHKRPKIDKSYCLMVDRLRNDYPDLFIPVCVVSQESDKVVFEQHNIETYLFPNNPIGAKHNFILSKLKDRCTHVLHLGSDDIIDNNYINEIIRYANFDYVWGLGLTFYSVKFKKARFWEEANMYYGGPGKLISSRLLNKVGWRIWEDKLNYGLDGSCYSILKEHFNSTFTKQRFNVKDTGCLLMDIKSEVNINPYDLFRQNGKQVDIKDIYKKLSQKEVDYLKSLN